MPWQIIRWIVVSSLINGCTKVVVNHSSLISSTGPRMAPDQAVAILTSNDPETALETEIASCIAQSIHADHPTVRVITADEFRRDVSPYQLPSGWAERNAYIEKMGQDLSMKSQMASLGIRYLIVAQGRTSSGNLQSAGGAGPAIIAQTSWDRFTTLSAAIVDTIESRIVLDLVVNASGTALVGIYIFVPVVVPAFTETEACKSLGQGISNFLAGKPIKSDTKEDAQPDP